MDKANADQPGVPPRLAKYQFAPGQSGNPGGRPKGRSVTSRLRELLEQGEINGKPLRNGQQVADLVTRVIIQKVLSGDPQFVKILLDRTEGKPTERKEISGEDGGPIKIKVVYSDAGNNPDDPEAASGSDEDPGGSEEI
jgi:hypothetical protein